ncbi:MAG: RNA polymerase sigma-70 factor [Saprospiraceae bacterium]|nr:RNA polymerase sigma-70 factor [Saprospiraceae bacterium]MBK8669346.1 RNA polymerase sigma-70 factor [Saprospiraceae bacterium]MBL0100540.1 RNA polymerase sigma-70 factor [Saprospiraceae bacterium]
MDKAGFKNLFDLHYSPLCNFAYRITGDLNQAEDVVQDVFVRLWDKRDQMDQERNIRSYIYTMVRNHALEIIRRQSLGSKINQELLYLQNDTEESPVEETEIEKIVILDQIYVSIRQLPPKCGEVFTLSKVNGLSYAQIAEHMDISIKTVENHMGKALKLLREMLNQSFNKH